MQNGYFITFEGCEGSGKSTQISMLNKYLMAMNFKTVLTHEPGGTVISQMIREVILDKSNTQMTGITETLLFSAARSQLVTELINPSIESGEIVLCDRFSDSTIAYQGWGRGQSIDAIYNVQNFATNNLVPDLTFLIDIDPEVGLQRKFENDNDWNRMENEDIRFHRNIRSAYLNMANQEPDRWVSINGAQSIKLVHEQITEITTEKIQNHWGVQ